MQNQFIGIEIGGTKIQLALGDDRGRISQRRRFAVAGRDGPGIRSLIEAALREWLPACPVHRLGVGFGGPVDWESGRVWKSHHVRGWTDFPLGEWLAALTGRPVNVDNDTNVGALAEACAGAAQDARVVFYTNQGTGVGGGLALGRAIYHGAKPGEAEFGHVLLDRQGTTVEQRCSGRAVDAKILRWITANPNGALARLVARETEGVARFMREGIELRDPGALAILRETADDLAFALSHVSQLFHPDVIVLGGGLSLIGEAWRAAVADRLRSHVMDVHQPGPQVRLAGLGEDVVLAGALLLAARNGQRHEAGPAETHTLPAYEKLV